MKTKINIISATLIIALAIGISAYAHGPNGGNPAPYTMGMGGNSMMGGGGMMGGYGSGHDMMGGYGNNGDEYRHDRGYQNKYRPRNHPQSNSDLDAEVESLRNQIQNKRGELSSLYRSGDADKALLDRKIDELNNLEKYLDEKISSGNMQQ